MTFSLQTADVGRRKFTVDEDDRLRSLVIQFGLRDWVTIGRHMPGRNARQCRHRYNNYLVEDHQSLAWTEQEEDILIEKFQAIGPKWVEIATHLPGRTGNDVKNRWHKHILKKRSITETIRLKQPTMSPIEHPFSDAPGLFDEIMAAVQAKNQSSAYLRFVLN